MYRPSKDYERMKMHAISIYQDYGITIADFPLDMDLLCYKMKIKVIGYSSFSAKSRKLLLKKSSDGFSCPPSKEKKALILFNDKGIAKSRISQTKAHEIKHIIEGDKDDSEDDLCDFFGKFLRCPLPLIIYLGINSVEELNRKFGISYEQAEVVISNVNSYKKVYGDYFMKSDVELLYQLLGDKMRTEELKVIDKTKEMEVYNILFG